MKLRSNNEIIIRQADKGGAVVIQNRLDYIAEANRQLQDTEYYMSLQNNPLPDFQQELIDYFKQVCKEGYLKESDAEQLIINEPRTPVFYTLPKIHKSLTSPKGRPIVSGYNSFTEMISHFVDFQILKISQNCSSYIKDTTDFLRKLSALGQLPDNSILVTMDVTSLYTVIDHDEGIQSIREAVDKHGSRDNIPSHIICRFLEFILKYNVFKFMDQLYIQTKGTAMGTPVAPQYANIFLDNIEKRFLNEFYESHGTKPLVWWRYLDDIFMIWTEGEDQLSKFIEALQNFTKTKNMSTSLQFEVNMSREEVTFLDTTIRLNNGCLTSDLYSKPTDSHFFLRRDSCHPNHCKTGLIYSQFLRLKRICSTNEAFLRRALEFRRYFLNRGYTRHQIDTAYLKSSTLKREDLLKYKEVKPTNRVPCVVTYHPNITRLSSILREHIPILAVDDICRKAFPEAPMVAYRRLSNIKQLITRTDIQTLEHRHAPSVPIKNPRCERAPCQTCKIHNQSERVNNTHSRRSIKVENPGTCTTANCIYCIQCIRCKKLYIGQTGNKLSLRINQHKSDIKLKKMTTCETAHHFNEANHTFQDMQVTILDHNAKWTETDRINREDFYISTLKTRHPDGINRRCGELAQYFYDVF
jgi:hypothetical protein